MKEINLKIALKERESPVIFEKEIWVAKNVPKEIVLRTLESAYLELIEKFLKQKSTT